MSIENTDSVDLTLTGLSAPASFTSAELPSLEPEHDPTGLAQAINAAHHQAELKNKE
jgi:hypothetical protein